MSIHRAVGPRQTSVAPADFIAGKLEQARGVVRQLRQLLMDDAFRHDHELRLALADELLREVEGISLRVDRPSVRQTAARVRAAIGLPTADAGAVDMPVETALAFLALAIDAPVETAEVRPPRPRDD